MQGYARICTRDEFRPFSADRESVFTMESALERMRELLVFRRLERFDEFFARRMAK